MAEIIARTNGMLHEFSKKRPIPGPFDLFLVLTRIGIFPVPYFALISCLMQRLTFNGQKNVSLMRLLCKVVKSRYLASSLPLFSRRYLRYFAEIFMNVSDFSAANRIFSCLHPEFPKFPEYPPIRMPVSGAFLMVTTL
jgi:hypothetical protein